MRTTLLATALAAVLLTGSTLARNALTPATIAKPSATVRATPDAGAAVVATLRQDDAVSVAGQQGLWFRLALAGGKSGWVRVNEVRMVSAKSETGGVGKALFTGKAGKGRVSETASVRGLDESALKAARFDAAQLERMESYRATAEDAEAAAEKRGWSATAVAYAGEFDPDAKARKAGKRGRPGKPEASQAEKRERFGFARGMLSQVSGAIGGVVASGEKLIGKSEQEVSEEELALGPMIAGRVLGAAPLVDDPKMQARVNLIGRWMASRTTRPDLPWAFGVVEDAEVNAFAAPGGYVLITRGLYQLLESDAEVAAVLGHEISHVVQRDHYEVVRKQELQGAGKDLLSSQVRSGGGVAGSLARDYVERNGAAIMLTQLDRDAEYRADHAAGVYLARAGTNPLALYAVLQKMLALGASSPRLTQLYRTHPPLDKRLDALDRSQAGELEPYLSR